MAKRRGPTPARPWQQMRFSHVPDLDPSTDGPDAPEHRREVWGNDRYTATVHHPPEEPGITVIGIHTRTRSAVGAHDWRHFQRIKNEICGPEREACEIYPAESRLLDTANEFWLWVLPEGEQFPFGFTEREVGEPEDIEPRDQITAPGRSPARQRKGATVA